MTLKDLLSSIPLTCDFIPNHEITSITENSRECDSHTLFVCIKGTKFNGHTYAADAYRRGCRAFIAQEEIDLPDDAFVITVEDTRRALAALACCFYENPSHKLKVIGITGTKGKTTVAYMIRHILEKSGISCGYIGTNGIDYDGMHIDSKNTTPDAITLQNTLKKMVLAGCHAVVLEVSSQALFQHRVDEIKFSCCIFTNLFLDHIGEGEHPSFEHYKACKHRLFTDFSVDSVVYNADDPHAIDMICNSTARLISCSSLKNADYVREDITPIRKEDSLGVTFTLTHNGECTPFSLPLIGDFNALNATIAATVAAECFDISPTSTASLLQDISVPGRSEVIHLKSGGIAVIDYAHNGASLQSLLENMRLFKAARLICLFGSVGDRTEIRRHELGEAAAQLSDFCIITSDNPGKEDPEKILHEIAAVVELHKTPYRCFVNREEAIRYGVEMLNPGDILVLAGKGHETYQLIGSEKMNFNEKEILLSADESLAKRSTV